MISVVNSVQDVELALRTILCYDLKCLVIVSQCEMTTMICRDDCRCVQLKHPGLSSSLYGVFCSARAPAFVARRLNRFEAVLAGPASHFDAPLTSFLMTMNNTACLQCQPNIDRFPSTLKRLVVTVEDLNAISLYVKVASSLCSGWVVFCDMDTTAFMAFA